jgi:hypothetical protein
MAHKTKRKDYHTKSILWTQINANLFASKKLYQKMRQKNKLLTPINAD